MKNQLLVTALMLAASMTSQAKADEDLAGPTQDLTPVSLNIRKVLGDDVSGGQVLRISLMVKNVGTLGIKRSRGGVRVGSLVNANASLYGPNGVGGYNLGANIAPGQTGMFLLYASVGAVKHCQKLRTTIDTAHNMQSGPNNLVFYNDTKTLTAIDPSSLKVCIDSVKP